MTLGWRGRSTLADLTGNRQSDWYSKRGHFGSLRVVHIIESLKGGGAEAMVRVLPAALAREGIDARVISIYDDGLSCAERAALGVPLLTVGRRCRSDITFFPRLVAAL